MELIGRRPAFTALLSPLPLLASLVLLSVLLDSETVEGSPVVHAPQQAAATPGMWFGPRLGRRPKRNLSPDQLARLIDLIEDAPWVLFSTNGNDMLSESKRHTANFTPRLGRESAEDSMGAAAPDRWLSAAAVGDSAADLMSQRSPPFAPRLGRAHYL